MGYVIEAVRRRSGMEGRPVTTEGEGNPS